jgi:CRISPR-associated protein Cmr2
MHHYDTSAYDHHLGLTRDSAKGPRLDEERLKEKACNFSNPGFGKEDLKKLPADSFVLEVKFKLVTPYISKDDMGPAEEHSPIVKDWVFQVPMVRPTTWKGRLRFSAAQQNNNHDLVKRLFGTLKESEDSLEGRLHFYPTFFAPAIDGETVTRKEIINPHNRRTRRGTVPVTLTCVKENSEGTLCLLYLGPALSETDLTTIKRAVVPWVREMIEFHGIGAKTLKGYGLGSISSIYIITESSKVLLLLDSEGGQQ